MSEVRDYVGVSLGLCGCLGLVAAVVRHVRWKLRQRRCWEQVMEARTAEIERGKRELGGGAL